MNDKSERWHVSYYRNETEKFLETKVEQEPPKMGALIRFNHPNHNRHQFEVIKVCFPTFGPGEETNRDVKVTVKLYVDYDGPPLVKRSF